jgi:hypothetical protein
MDAVASGLTGYHDKLVEITSDIVNHGWGEAVIRISSFKDNQTEIKILAGKTWIFFVKKQFDFDKDKIF